ncbi:LysR family transcriptional regulator [Bacteriovoracaceae bacterium]|nr:LysR family transcriptional regulator [Bacteriovoracaceae bacterium]
MILRREIEDFIITSKFLNISKAADYLGIKQAGLSKNILKLEQELNKKLFIRHSRGLNLTEAGNLYLEELKKIQYSCASLNKRMDSLFSELSGQYKISFHSIIAKFFLSKLSTDLFKYPSIKLDFDFCTSRQALQKVLYSESDLAVVAGPTLYPELVIKKLWTEYIGLYSKDGEKKSILCYNDEMLNAHKYLRFYPQSQHQVINDYNILYSMIKRTKGLMGLLPSPLAFSENKLKLIKRFSPTIDIALVYRSDHLKTKSFQYLTKTISSKKFK